VLDLENLFTFFFFEMLLAFFFSFFFFLLTPTFFCLGMMGSRDGGLWFPWLCILDAMDEEDG